MGNVLVNEASLQDIANAIREKTESTDKFLPSQMADAVRGIISGEGDVTYNGLRYNEGTVLVENGVEVFVNHNSGFIPEIFILYPKFEVTVGSANEEVGFVGYYGDCFGALPNQRCGFLLENRTTYIANCSWQLASTWKQIPIDETSVKIPYRSSAYPFRVAEYGWIAIAEKGIESGGEDYARYAKVIQFTDDSELPSKVTLNLDTVTSLASLFSNTKVQELSITTKQQITSLQRMIYPTKANSLKKIVLNFDTSKVTNMTQAFCWIKATDAEIVGELNLSSVTTMTTPFAYSGGLKEVRFAKETIKVSLFIDACSELSEASIQSMIDGLAFVETTQTLKLHVNVKAKLTDEQKAQITSKNWTIP